MDKKARFRFLIVIGAAIIGSSIFLTFKYLFKGPPMLKVLAVIVILGVCYLVIDFIKRKSKELENGNNS